MAAQPVAAASANGSAAPKTNFSEMLRGEFDEAGTAAVQPNAFGEDGLTFGDFLDIINPLQHLPIVSTVYRALTGDEISTGARLAGDTLYGGPIGLLAGIANSAMIEATGRDIGENALAMLGIGGDADVGEAVADAGTMAGNALAPEAAPVPPVADNALAMAAASQLAAIEPAAGKPKPFGGAMAAVEPKAMPTAESSVSAAPSGLELSPGAQAALLRLTGAPVPASAPATAMKPAETRPKMAEEPGAEELASAIPTARPEAPKAQNARAMPSSLIAAQEAKNAPTSLKPEEIPGAMMAALEKYEALRRGKAPSRS